jgi:hypothetical protein
MKFQFKISYVARIAHKTIYGGAEGEINIT